MAIGAVAVAGINVAGINGDSTFVSTHDDDTQSDETQLRQSHSPDFEEGLVSATEVLLQEAIPESRTREENESAEKYTSC